MANNGRPPRLTIDPPLVNSSNPWATTLEDLTQLYMWHSTGAVTTRTSLLDGFNHDPARHKYVFFDAASHGVTRNSDQLNGTSNPSLKSTGNSSLNSLGYSPLPLDSYLSMIEDIDKASGRATKGFIVSVTGSPAEVAECYRRIHQAQSRLTLPLAMEINLSCPNIPNSPPPAYSGESLARYLTALATAEGNPVPRIPFGLKTPPYTHSTEFQTLVDALLASATSSPQGVCPVSFITATNTLGSCLVMSPAGLGLEDQATPAFVPPLPGWGLGGMAGTPLHPLALGNVGTLRRMFDAHERELGHIQIIGVGGVLDGEGYKRMKAVGAYAVGVGTGLGLRGVEVFQDIEREISGQW